MAYDDVIRHIGEFGIYQKKICLLLFLAAIPSALHSMATVFLTAEPAFRCLLPNEKSENVTYQLPSAVMNMAYPLDEKIETWSQCERYALNLTYYDLDGNFSTTTDTAKCDAFVYDKTTYELTTVTEFDLVCDNEWLKATPNSLFMIGMMAGALFFGELSDRYGRKRILCSTIIVNLVSGFLVALSPEIISYIIFRLILGTSVNAIYLIIYVSAMEMVVPERRLTIGVCIEIFYTTGYILTSAFAYFFTNWRFFQISITIPSLFFLLYWWLIPESVRWLLSKGRLHEAKQLILKASSTNGVEISKDTLDTMLNDDPANSSEVEKSSVLDLFRHPNLRKKTLLLFFNWLVNNCTYYGLSWNTSNLGGNDYLNAVISGLVEYPAHVFIYFTLDRFGRRTMLCGCLLLAGVSLLLITLVPTGMSWLIILLAMIGKLAITASYTVTYVFSTEQYPTVIRNVGVGACSTVARIGGILAPYILYLSSVWTYLPYVIFGSGALITGLLALLLPETLNQKLPESIEDGEAFGKKKWPQEKPSIIVEAPHSTTNAMRT